MSFCDAGLVQGDVGQNSEKPVHLLIEKKFKKVCGADNEAPFSFILISLSANDQPILADGKAKTTDGFTDSLRVMLEESQAFGKPVLAIHGDSHFFRFDKPLARADGKALDNFFRLEVPGEDDAHWVRVDVDPSTPSSPFRVQHITVPENANR